MHGLMREGRRKPVLYSTPWRSEANSRIALAHADMSGFSPFEEAQYRGVVAAERVLARQSGDASTPA